LTGPFLRGIGSYGLFLPLARFYRPHNLLTYLNHYERNQMKSQPVKFYLSTYHLARGLTAVRQFDPTYQPSSIHQLVKLIFFDYCAKTSIARSEDIPHNNWQDILALLPGTKGKPRKMASDNIMFTLSQLDAAPKVDKPTKVDIPPFREPAKSKQSNLNPLFNDVESASIKNNVTDFSLPKELLDQINEEES